MSAQEKQRLDIVVTQRLSHLSRQKAQSLIMQGKVRVDGVVVTKAGTKIASDASVEVAYEEPKYVSRAGFKLEKALDHFQIDVRGLIVLDSGISTGGFTDCLLQRGAKRVYGVDVGYGDVHEKIRNDQRVILLERTNLRKLASLPELVDLVTLDLSFISVLKVMPAIKRLIKPSGRIIMLIKPQFEARREDVKRGGVVDQKIHQSIIQRVQEGMEECGYEMVGVVESPIRGAKAGNIEYLALFIGQAN